MLWMRLNAAWRSLSWRTGNSVTTTLNAINTFKRWNKSTKNCWMRQIYGELKHINNDNQTNPLHHNNPPLLLTTSPLLLLSMTSNFLSLPLSRAIPLKYAYLGYV